MIVLSTEDKLALRGITTALGISGEPGSEAETALRIIDHIVTLIENAGGEPPLPEKSAPSYLSELRAFTGNQLVLPTAPPDVTCEFCRHWKIKETNWDYCARNSKYKVGNNECVCFDKTPLF